MKKKLLSSCLLTTTLMVGCSSNSDVENLNINDNTSVAVDGINTEVSDEVLKQRAVLKEKADKLLDLFGEKKALTIEEIESVIYESAIDDGMIEKLDVEDHITYQAGGDSISILKGVENEITTMDYSYEGSLMKLGYDSRLEVPVYTVERIYNNSKDQIDSLSDFEKSDIELAYLDTINGLHSEMKISEVESITNYTYPEDSIISLQRDVDTIDGTIQKNVTDYSRSEGNEGFIVEVMDDVITSIHYSNAPEDVNNIKEIKSYSCTVNEDKSVIFNTKIIVPTKDKQTEILKKIES